ncbi:MAG: hypothetical protein SX243_18725 [Acidobacteriota bacterium]|nr:hypothetical protein [Acidobacteriota bacterium]
MKARLTRYRVEIYVNSYRDDPIAGFWSSTPFMPIQVGDEIDPWAWSEGDGESYSNKGMCPDDSLLEVIGVRHLMMIGASGIIQSISVRVRFKERAS